MTGSAAARLKLVVRSYGGENDKNRPPYYSKLLALTSFVRAARAVPEAEVVFLNDGPIPEDRLALMERSGAVRQIAAEPQGMRASYWHALNLPDQLGWDDDDVVFFVEDDYMFTAEAFVSLVAAVDGLPQASYFALYGERIDYDDEADRRRFSVPYGWVSQPTRTVGADTWFNLPSTTSTFGGRVGALRADLPVFRMCMRPFRRRFLDHETCVIYQGHVPYHGLELLLGAPDDFVPSLRGVVRTTFLVPFRIALNVQAKRRSTAHYLYALTPNGATHMEYPVISPDRDWAAEAESVVEWAKGSDLGAVAQRLQATRH
jgi:hypothetical protein